MKIIYLQTTVDYMFQMNPNLLREIEMLGEPKIKEIMNSNNEPIKYYIFES